MIKNIINNKLYEIVIKERFIHLKNYVNIVDISKMKIVILLNCKKLIINGNDLMICKMDEYELIINGNIKGIDFINE